MPIDANNYRRRALIVAALGALVGVAAPALSVAAAAGPDSPDSPDIETCTIEAHRLPPLVVPERYDLRIDASALAERKFTGRVQIHARYTDELPGTPRVTFMSLLSKVCRSVLSCAIERQSRLPKRQIVLNVGRTLDIERILVDRLVADGSGQAPAPAVAGESALPTSGGSSSRPLDVEFVCMDRTSQLMAITLAKKPARDEQLLIQIEYRGQITQGSRGFYESLNRLAAEPRAPDTEAEGGAGTSTETETETETQSAPGAPSGARSFIESAGANTHFFPADARTTLPCFDQPDLKAVFSLTLVHPSDLVAVSNTEVASSQLEAATGRRTVRFADTPPMSSYLLAFAVGRFESISCQAGGRRRPLVSAYAPAGRAHLARYFLDIVCGSIPAVETYLRTEFPLAKLDIVSSRQMTGSARENWGLLALTEDILLADERDTTPATRQALGKLAAHLVMHQWIGNLVTTRWWDDQWIYDGLAIWRAHAIGQAVKPELSYHSNYLIRVQSPMLDAHALGSVRPIKTLQNLSADEELALFEPVTYIKAVALFQMTQTWLGEFVLRDALLHFLNAYKYSHASQQNLTRFLDSTSGLELGQYLDRWLTQPGAPLVIVARAGRNELALSQERLLADDDHTTWAPSAAGTGTGAGAGPGAGSQQRAKSGASQVWTIPIDIIFSDGNKLREVVRTVLSERTGRVTGPAWFKHHEKGHWFKLNVNFNSFYRVKYPKEALNYLQAPIQGQGQQVLSPQDRYNIIDDLRGLYNLKKITTDDLLMVLDWYKGELHGGVLSGLGMVVDALAARESPQRVQEIALGLFGRIFEEQRFKVTPGQSEAELLGRQDALERLVQHNHEPALEEAVQVFEASSTYLEPFLRRPVYLAVLKRGSDAQIEELVQRLKAVNSDLERAVLFGVLGKFAPSDPDHPWNRLTAKA